jgi:hypothetical protein
LGEPEKKIIYILSFFQEQVLFIPNETHVLEKEATKQVVDRISGIKKKK